MDRDELHPLAGLQELVVDAVSILGGVRSGALPALSSHRVSPLVPHIFRERKICRDSRATVLASLFRYDISYIDIRRGV